MVSRSLFEISTLFFCSLIIFCLGLSSQEIIGFESRFYLFLLEMFRHGITSFPTTYGEPYADYPVTSTLLMFFAASFLGGVNKLTAVLPSALAASLTLVFTYLIGALHHKRWGWVAVFFLLFTFTFLKSARTISLDMYPTFFTAACFYLVYSADIKGERSRLPWVFVLLFLSFAFRGPIGLVMPAGVICTYYLIDKRFKQLIITGLLASLLLIASTLLLLAEAKRIGGIDLVQDVLRMQVLGRINNTYQPIYFYFIHGFTNYALSFPVALLTVVGAIYYAVIKRKYINEIKFIFKLAGWVAIILIGMTIPGDKKVRYVLPMAPALALLAAYPFVASQDKSYFRFLQRALQLFFSACPLIFLVATIFIYFYSQHLNEQVNFAYAVIMPILFFLTLFSLWFRREKIILLSALAIFVVVMLMMVEPLELYLDKTRSFVLQVEGKRLAAHAKLVFYKEKRDGLPIKYLINMSETDAPIFINNEESLAKFSEPAFFVASYEYFQALPKALMKQYRVVAENKMAHIKVVVFTKS